MLQKIVESLIEKDETLWLEFKSKWYWQDSKIQAKEWGEFLKDFSALFNYINQEDQEKDKLETDKDNRKYLIIGVDETSKKCQDFDINAKGQKISKLENIESLKKIISSKLRRHFIGKPEYKGSTDLVDIESFFDVTSLSIKGKNLLVFVFYSAPYLIEIKETLQGNETFRKGSIIIRKLKNDGTPENDNASYQEIEGLEKIIKIRQKEIYPDKDISIEKIVRAFRDKFSPASEISSLASERNYLSGIYFEIFKIEGEFFNTTNFVYFSKYTSQNKTIKHIVDNCLLNKETSSIVLIDKFNKSKGLIDKPRIKQLFQDNQFNVNIDYLEDFAFDKLYRDLFDPQIFHQGNFNISDFVKPYTSSSNDKTVDILLSEWYESPRKPLAVIKGMGGIGKTTVIKYFLDELYKQAQNVNILFINSHEIINDIMKSPKVESIYDFYRIVAEKIEDIKKIDEKLFELSIDNGNLVIPLDGIDEVIAKVTRFDTGTFIDSIFQNYSENLERAKILITCRDYFWDDSLKSNYPIERILLDPFSEKLAETYFRHHFSDENKVKKAMNLANDFAQSSDEAPSGDKKEKIYIPYILDMIREDLMTREDLLSKSSPQKIQTKILQVAEDTNDYLVGKVCEREIVKLENLLIDSQINFLVHIAFSYNGIVHQKQMGKVESALKNQGVTSNQLEKFKGHPLLMFDKDREILEFRFDFFNEYFKIIGLSVFLKKDLAKNISSDIIDTITQYVSYDNSFTKALQKRLRNIDFDFHVSIWDFLTGKIDNVIDDIERKKQLNSSLFTLLMLLKNANDIEKRTDLLKEIYEHERGIIKNLCIINLHSIKGKGKITFDFRSLTFEKCFFENYEHFSACKFDEKTYFVETKFVAPLHTQGIKPQVLSINIDKSSCDIAGIIDVIDEVERVYESKDLILRQDLKQVIKFFWQGSAFKQKLASEANKKLRVYSNIMEALIKNKIIQVTTVTTYIPQVDK